MDLCLDKKVFIIAGGAGREGSIGAAISMAIAKEGGIPAILDNSERGNDLVDHLGHEGLDAIFEKVDVTQPKDLEHSINVIGKKYGHIDGVVNNVGVNDGIGFDASPEEFIASLRLNLVSYWLTVKYSLPMLKKSGGSIVNIASKVAVTGQGGTSSYAAAKGGILALTREWAIDLIQYGIRVNAVVPSEVWTPSYADWISSVGDGAKKLAQIQQKIPLQSRMTTPEEIADTVLFLLSERSSHTTGQWVFVDGGYVHLDRSLLTKS